MTERLAPQPHDDSLVGHHAAVEVPMPDRLRSHRRRRPGLRTRSRHG